MKTKKRVVVSGAGSGIGRAIARRFLADGHEAVLLGRRVETLQETLDCDGAERGVAVACDVGDTASVRDVIDACTAGGAKIDVLVNNAGLGGPNAIGEEGSAARWREILRVNLDGVYFLTEASLPHMPDGGRVLNISSVLGKFGVPGYTAYCTSKHGLVGFTRALALELAPRSITVNAICPGWTDTEMARQGMELLAEAAGQSFEEAKRDALGLVPLGRMIDPAEIAGLAAWIASEEAAGMTGQAVNYSGGSAVW